MSACPRSVTMNCWSGVRAASVNPLDWHFMRGSPYLVRIAAGLSRPKASAGRLGADMAGTVEAVGTNVTGFRPGDEVFGGLEDFTRARGEYDLLIDIAA